MINYLDKNSVTISSLSTYIPFGLTAVSLIEVFVVYVVIPKLSEEHIKNSHYFTYLKAKNPKDTLWALIPIIGNIYCCIFRYKITLEILNRNPTCMKDEYFQNFWKSYPKQRTIISNNPEIFDYLSEELQNRFISEHGDIINSFIRFSFYQINISSISNDNTNIAMKWLSSHPHFFKHLTHDNINKVKNFVQKNPLKYKETILHKLLFWNQLPALTKNERPQKTPVPTLEYLSDNQVSAPEIRESFKNKKDIFFRKPGYFSKVTPSSTRDKLWEDLKFIAYIAEEPKALSFMYELSQYNSSINIFKEKIIELIGKNPLMKKNIILANPKILMGKYSQLIDISPETLFYLDSNDLRNCEALNTPEYYLEYHKNYLFSKFSDRLMLRIIYDSDLTAWKYLSNSAFNEPEVIKAFKNLSLEERGAVLVHIGDRAPKNIYKMEDHEIKQIRKWLLSGKDDPLLLQCLPLLPVSSPASYRELTTNLMDRCTIQKLKYLIISLNKNLLVDPLFNPQNWRKTLSVVKEVFALKPELLDYLCDEKGIKFGDNINFIRVLNNPRAFVCARNSALEKMNAKEWSNLMEAIEKKSFPWRQFSPSKDFMDMLSTKEPKILQEILPHIIDLKQLSLLLLCQKKFNKVHKNSLLSKPIITKIFLHQYSLNSNLLYTLYEMMNPQKVNLPETEKSLSARNISKDASSKKPSFIESIKISAKVYFRKFFRN